MADKDAKLDSNQVNSDNRGKHTAHEIANAMRNFRKLHEEYDSTVFDIADMAKHTGKRAAVVASGPSLIDTVDQLKDFDGPIFCSQSQAKFVAENARPPDYIVALDPFAAWHHIDNYDWKSTNTILIATPTVWPNLIANWPNKIGLFLQSDGRPSWHDSTLPAMYSLRSGYRYDAEFVPMIRTRIPSFSSTAALQLLLASIFECSSVYLFGCDFGYSEHGRQFITRFDAASPESAIDGLIYADNECPSDAMQLFYKRNFLTAARLSLAPIAVVGNGGAIGSELPRVNHWHDTIEFAPIDHRKATLETYLAANGCYTIFTDKGALLFVESDNPEQEIPPFCQRINDSGEHRIDISENMRIIRSRAKYQS